VRAFYKLIKQSENFEDIACLTATFCGISCKSPSWTDCFEIQY